MRYSRDQTHCGSQTHVKCTQPGGTLPVLELNFKHSCAQCLYKQYFREMLCRNISQNVSHPLIPTILYAVWPASDLSVSVDTFPGLAWCTEVKYHLNPFYKGADVFCTWESLQFSVNFHTTVISTNWVLALFGTQQIQKPKKHKSLNLSWSRLTGIMINNSQASSSVYVSCPSPTFNTRIAVLY